MKISVGTHNLHDQTGTPTPFASIIVFTEAIAWKVVNVLGDHYDVHVCADQRDLVIAIRSDLNAVVFGDAYHRSNGGIPLVTPNRGTYVLKLSIDGKRVKVIAEHRINAAFPPFKRGEKILRPRFWQRHTRLTLGIIRRAIANGWEVVSAGDTNTPPDVLAYEGVIPEVRKGLDRIGTTGKITRVHVLSPMGSDHPRLRAEVEL